VVVAGTRVLIAIRSKRKAGEYYQFSDAGRADYKTDYIVVGRSWTALDDASANTGNSSRCWTTLDEAGHCAECSKTAGCRFDSWPTCPARSGNTCTS